MLLFATKILTFDQCFHHCSNLFTHNFNTCFFFISIVVEFYILCLKIYLSFSMYAHIYLRHDNNKINIKNKK